MELVEIAKNALREDWTGQRVYAIISKICHDFNSIRDFIKKKDKKVMLSSYSDIGKHDLSKLFSLSDFEGEDKILIEEAFPTTNFRSSRFPSKVTDEKGFLKLTDSISRFQMRYGNSNPDGYNQMVLYNCQSKDGRVKFYPNMNNYPVIRNQAKRIAKEWGMGSGRCCFTTDNDRAEEMLLGGGFQIGFPDLCYLKEIEPHTSYAQITERSVKRYAIGRFIGAGASGESIRDLLKKHGVSIKGAQGQAEAFSGHLAAKRAPGGALLYTPVR